ncbi:MAG: zinc-binding dehydrogenase [Chloroflexi bacterium]|nr:zinc-binding dehydrogenase [Chloroflexota bacterium]
MLAAIQTGVRTIEMRDVPEPQPDDTYGIVRVRRVGICGSDLHPYHGRAEPQSLPAGHEVCGEVVSLPPSYQGPARVGDLVAVDSILGMACGACSFCATGQAFHCPERHTAVSPGGGFAEYFKRRPQSFFPLPPGLTAQHGALAEPLAVGVHGVRWPRMQRGDTVVVIGAGTIGLMTLVAAKALGASRVYITARHAHQAAMATALGATAVLPESTENALEQIRTLTDGVGADLVVETVGGHADTLSTAWELVRPQGKVAVVGVFPDRLPVDLLRPLQKEVWVTFPICYGVVDGRHDYEVALELMATAKAPVEQMVTRTFPLAEAPAAFKMAADKGTGAVKIHLTNE